MRPTARVMGSSSSTGYHRRLAKLHRVLARAYVRREGGGGGAGRPAQLSTSVRQGLEHPAGGPDQANANLICERLGQHCVVAQADKSAVSGAAWHAGAAAHTWLVKSSRREMRRSRPDESISSQLALSSRSKALSSCSLMMLPWAKACRGGTNVGVEEDSKKAQQEACRWQIDAGLVATGDEVAQASRQSSPRAAPSHVERVRQLLCAKLPSQLGRAEPAAGRSCTTQAGRGVLHPVRR